VGLSGSGKTTISRIVESKLKAEGVLLEILDGDEIRKIISADLGFGYDDRMTHIRRTAFVASLLARNGIVVLAPLITPYREMREYCREKLQGAYLEIYVECPIEICIERDVKGLYRKALRGEIPMFTGLTDRFDEPDNPDLFVRAALETPEQSADNVVALLRAYWRMEENGVKE
jgi:adenylylsulfate kinase